MAEPHHDLFDQIGRYRVLALIGRGAMGEVLGAHDPVLDRQVAIKYLRRDLRIENDQREGLIDRLWQEARASARISHPNIVSLHDMGEDPRLGPYLVFERVEGSTLKERLESGRLDSVATARLARELGDALTTAHRAGVLHRDIKPENIILSPVGAKIADFGIARIPNSNLTRGGTLLGTPAYSAPETLDGARFSKHSDQFSLAATLYEAYTGERAFPGDDAILVAGRVRTEEPVPLRYYGEVPDEVVAVFARAFSKKPEHRYEDCADFGAALSDALLGHSRPEMPTIGTGNNPDSITALSSSIGMSPAAGRRSLPALSVQGVMTGAAFLGLVAYFLLSTPKQPEPSERSQAVTHVMPTIGAAPSVRSVYVEDKDVRPEAAAGELSNPAAGSHGPLAGKRSGADAAVRSTAPDAPREPASAAPPPFESGARRPSGADP